MAKSEEQKAQEKADKEAAEAAAANEPDEKKKTPAAEIKEIDAKIAKIDEAWMGKHLTDREYMDKKTPLVNRKDELNKKLAQEL